MTLRLSLVTPLLVVVAFIVWTETGLGQPRPSSPPAEKVRELERALQIPDPKTRTETLDNIIAQLQTPADLACALQLEEWRGIDEEVRALDKLSGQLLISARNALKGDDATREAILVLVGELVPPDWRTAGTHHLQKVAVAFAGDAVQQLESTSPSVGETAAWALGRIPFVDEPATALGKLFGSKAEVRVRRAAAEALGNWLQSAMISRPFDTMPEVLMQSKAIPAVIAATGRGLKDEDADVRRLTLDALRTTVWGLAPVYGPDEEETRLRQPVLDAVNQLLAAIIAAAKDEAAPVGLAACQVLETVAKVRVKAMHRPNAKEMFPGLTEAVPVLARRLSQQDVKVRLAVLYALENFESDATPALAGIVQAAKDENPYVRWAVARVLGKTAPREPGMAVPALGDLLADRKEEVRITAAAALERYGAEAKPAVPKLAEAVRKGDTGTRVWCLRALMAVGAEAGAAVPDVVEALAATEVPVRILAATALGRIGPSAKAAREALRKALRDADPAVRKAAAEALLLKP